MTPAESGAGAPAAGPACGWALAYVEIFLHDYHMPLAYILGSDPRHYLSLDAGLAILDARRERLQPGSLVGHVQRAIARARDAVRAWHEARGNLSL